MLKKKCGYCSINKDTKTTDTSKTTNTTSTTKINTTKPGINISSLPRLRPFFQKKP